MRSNIARTCVSGSVPAAAPLTASLPELTPPLSERRQELDQLVELLGVLLGEPAVRRHRRSRVEQRAADRRRPQTVADVGQLRARPGVAVVADAVAAQAARGGHHLLARLVLGRRFELDLRGAPARAPSTVR